MDIQGSHILLTGASSGIGRALAVELAKRGAAAVVLVSRRADALADVSKEVEAAGARALAIPADVADRASIEAAVRRAELELGRLDIVIANAGIGGGGRRVSADDLAKVTQVNFLGASWTLLAAMDGMVSRGRGQLVAITSLAALRGLPMSAEYSASKAALETLLEGLRVQLRGTGVDVSVIRPGFVDTPINQHLKSRPFLLTAEDGARRIADAIARNARTYGFPLPTNVMMNAVGALPGFLFDAVAGRMVPRKR